MKFNFYTATFFVLFSKNGFAQPNQCNCLDNLRKLQAKTEENYAGYTTKVNATTKASYKKRIITLEKKAKLETNPKSCFYLLKDYIRFFEDKHFMLSYYNESDFDNEIINVSENAFQKSIANKKLTTIEGIWINADSTLKLAIQPFQNNIFKAIVLQTKDSTIPQGLVYMTLKKNKNNFIVKEYNSFITTDVPAKQKGNLLQIWNFAMFGKIYPTSFTKIEKNELATWRNNNNGLDFKQLSKKTAYLKIPSFKQNDDKIQQLVEQNDSIIKSCENLIVDLTGNAGGSTGWISFLPYFMTNPIVQFDTYLRVTPENVKSKLNDLEPFVVNPIPEAYKKYFPDETLAAYKKAYHELPITKRDFYPIPGVTFPLDAKLVNPKKIALVVDDFCGSSAEYFFSLSKQSKKTTTYGIPTIGMMDYEGMSNPTPMPYPNYFVTIPIVKSSWTDKNPIDKTGFKPVVILDKIPPQKWVAFLQKEMEKK